MTLTEGPANSKVVEGQLLWTPSAERIAAAQLTRFRDRLRDERGLIFTDYNTLWRWSVTNKEEFWRAL